MAVNLAMSTDRLDLRESSLQRLPEDIWYHVLQHATISFLFPQWKDPDEEFLAPGSSIINNPPLFGYRVGSYRQPHFDYEVYAYHQRRLTSLRQRSIMNKYQWIFTNNQDICDPPSSRTTRQTPRMVLIDEGAQRSRHRVRRSFYYHSMSGTANSHLSLSDHNLSDVKIAVLKGSKATLMEALNQMNSLQVLSIQNPGTDLSSILGSLYTLNNLTHLHLSSNAPLERSFPRLRYLSLHWGFASFRAYPFPPVCWKLKHGRLKCLSIAGYIPESAYNFLTEFLSHISIVAPAVSELLLDFSWVWNSISRRFWEWVWKSFPRIEILGCQPRFFFAVTSTLASVAGEAKDGGSMFVKRLVHYCLEGNIPVYDAQGWQLYKT
ncbi:hypothetical protein CPB86DRAFT_783550 [Serendipita vermifera]|nr:hypothetical protein CPB86DRAFT_783550 [Serendipita vermifera]